MCWRKWEGDWGGGVYDGLGGPWGEMETKKETLLSISSKSIRSQSLLMGHWVVEGVWNPGAWEEIQARGDRGIDE